MVRRHGRTAGCPGATTTTAVELLDQAESKYLRGFFPDVRPIPAIRALIHIGQGLVDEAWDWAREHQVTAVMEPAYLNEFNLLTLARLLVATARSEGESTEVRGMMPTLVRLLEEAEAGGRVRSVVEILVPEHSCSSRSTTVSRPWIPLPEH